VICPTCADFGKVFTVVENVAKIQAVIDGRLVIPKHVTELVNCPKCRAMPVLRVQRTAPIGVQSSRDLPRPSSP
jgi:hypothetical protein